MLLKVFPENVIVNLWRSQEAPADHAPWTRLETNVAACVPPARQVDCAPRLEEAVGQHNVLKAGITVDLEYVSTKTQVPTSKGIYTPRKTPAARPLLSERA